MNPISSLRCFVKLLSDDAAVSRLGAPRGWLMRMHYRGRWADRRKQMPPTESVALHVRGRPLTMDLSAAYEGAFKGIFLDDEYDCASLLTVTPARILDLGANIGMGALYLSALFPQAEFVCVEPDPRNVPLLEKNLRANNLQAKVKACAVGATAGSLDLRFGDNPTCSALESSPMHSLAERTRVPVETVPDILKHAGWDRADFVKIDIEGSEDELLSRNSGWLAQVGAVMLEIHPNTTPDRIRTYLQPFQFQLRQIGWKSEPVYLASRPS